MGGKSSSQTIGYWYDMDILSTLCHGKVDGNTDFEIVEFRFGDRTGWTGLVTSSSTISIYQMNLFGGETREGGVHGQVDIMIGTLDQPINEYLGTSMRSSGITGPVPAYRGELSIFFRGVAGVNPEFTDGTTFVQTATPPPLDAISNIFDKLKPQPRAFRWSAMNPYLKAFKVKIRRFWKGWYAAKARIGNQANPAHIVVECLTNSEWGMGYPQADLDTTRLQAAADTLYTEGFGIGLVWRQQTSIQEFISMVLQHINGVLNTDRSTGRIFLRLVRNDYVISSLLELNPYNSVLQSYSRPTFGETVNEVTLKYTTSEGTVDSVTVQDLANITSQGQIVPQVIEMPGLRDAALAARIAQRELESRSKPICKLSITTNRAAFNLYEGEVFKFSWPEHGIEQMICRVVEMDLGRLQDNVIHIEAIEDVFGLPAASYVSPQAGGWVDPSNMPAASPLRYITETPYYDLARSLTPADLATLDPTDCFLDVFAKAPSRDAMDYNLWTASGTNDVEQRGTGSHSPTTTLTAAAIQEEFSVFQVGSVVDIISSLDTENAYIVINGEYCKLTDYNTATNTLSVARGVLDTVPKAHAIGSTVMLGDNNIGHDGISYAPGESAKIRVQTRTGRGVLDINSTPQDTYTFTQRQYKPYPPGRLRLNGAAYPARVNGLLTVNFATRNRLTQTGDMVAQDVTSITPEVLQLNKVVVKGEGGVTLLNTTDIATTFEVTFDMEALSNVKDTAATRNMRSIGIGLMSGTVPTAITAAGRAMPVVNGGRLGISSTNGVFVNTTTGVTTTRTPGFQGTQSSTLFSFKPGVYHSSNASDPYVGYAVFDPLSELTVLDIRISQPIRDRRVNPEFIILLTGRRATLRYWAQTVSSIKSLFAVDVGFHILQKSAVVTGPGGTNRVTIENYYLGEVAQFDSPTTSNLPVPTFSGLLSDSGDLTYTAQIGCIFGNLFYVTYVGPSTLTNTAGKVVDITNILTAHINVTQNRVDRTRVYTIDSAGNVTLLSTRDVVIIADQVTSTLAVEAQGTTLRTVNITTGVVGGTIATAPSAICAICGDTVSSEFYALGVNGTLYRYSIAGTLLGSVVVDIYPSTANAYLKSGVHVSSQSVFVKDKNSALHHLPKNLSSQRIVDLAPMFNGSGVTNISYIHADPASTEMDWVPVAQTGAITIIGGLVDESSASTTIPNIATPRYNDSLLVEASSVRDGLNSHTTHQVTVPRQGMGLRMGESMGG